MSEAGEAIDAVIGSTLDLFHSLGNFFKDAADDVFSNTISFFELWGVIAEIPKLLISYLWGPIGICIGCIVFVALIRMVLGWGNT